MMSSRLIKIYLFRLALILLISVNGFKARAQTPVITTTIVTGTIAGCQGSPSSSPNVGQFSVAGTALTGDLTITPPTGFDISLTAVGGYSPSLVLKQAGGTVINTTIYVRSSAADPAGPVSGSVQITTSGASATTVPVSGTVYPLQTINPVSNQVVNAGSATTPVIFTGTGDSYTWTNSNPAIGLPASGTGYILAFTATNNTNAPITGTITATPNNSFTGCSGPPATFTITVDPVANQPGITAGVATGFIESCVGTASASPHIEQIIVSGANLSGNVTVAAPPGFEISAVPSGSYSNSLPLPQSGGTVNNTTIYVRSSASAPTGNISGNIAFSSPGVPDANVPVTGLIDPIITVNAVSNQTVQANTQTTPVNFTGTANAYTWTNSNPAIGLPVSGTGNIQAFTGVNNGATPVTATITVLPAQASYAYVTDYEHNVNVINTLTGQVIATVPVDNSPTSVAVSPDGSRIYVCNLNSGDVSVIDGSTNQVTTIPVAQFTFPYYVALSPDGSRLYVACSANNNVAVINTATNKIIANVSVGNNPICITASLDGTTLYVTNQNDKTISVISTANYAVTKTISLDYNPYATAISPDGRTLYVVIAGADSRVIIIDTSTGNAIADIPAPTSAQSIAITPDGSKLYVTSSNANEVTVISTATNSILTTIPVNNGPFGIAVSPDGTTVCTTNGNNNDVSIINTATDKVIQTVKASSALSLGQFVTGGFGCIGSPATFTITVEPALPPSFSASADLKGLITTYGTPSAPESFTISGSNMKAGVLVTPPAGFEVSTDNVNFSTTVNAGSAGTITSVPVYIRLAATTPAGNAYTGNIVLSTTGATNVDVDMPNSVVNKAPLTIAANNQSKPQGAPNPELTLTYSGFVNGDGPDQLTTPPLVTTTATTNSAVGQYAIIVNGAKSPNYDFTYVNGMLTVTPSLQYVHIPNAFTPNGDGVNDYWNIPQLAYYPNCLVSIFSRYGSLVFQSRGYGKPWDGTSNGSPVPVGTYYYVIDPLQNGSGLLSGFVAVLR